MAVKNYEQKNIAVYKRLCHVELGADYAEPD